MSDSLETTRELEILRERLQRLEVINTALMDRVERSVDSAGSAYSLFESNIYLQNRIRERTTALESTNEELLKAKRQAEAASMAKSMFLANMSHELRTPLSAINGFASILLRETYGNLNPRQKQHAGNILSSGEHLLGIINDLLDLAKIEAGKLEMSMVRINLTQISLEAKAMIEESLLSKNLRLVLDIPEEPLYFMGDVLRLRQAILNLLSNSIKFTETGSVTLYLRQVSDEIDWGVIDTGIGIEKHNLDSLFKPFERIKSNLSDTVKGTGLGLALTKQIVDAHGGKLLVESSFGNGSDFRIRLYNTGKIKSPSVLMKENFHG
jgi:signal transduction histidine kinase